ncbi:hypothetical protein V1264_023588 [Littorina saxatilis]|uniref:Disks large-associated protein 5 n=2 Tax=Littorina saxatilis TaxID=31220 RepID=A0AAN9B8K1_9CAEN
MASRGQSYKKPSTMDKRDKRLMRVHRRSLDQREMRLDEVNKRRQIDDMSPVSESQDGSKNPSGVGTPVNQKAALSRLERLKKWKEEKELKKKLEAMERARSKPGFKVAHLTHIDKDIFVVNSSCGQKTAQISKKVEKAPPSKQSAMTSRQPQPKVQPPSKARTTQKKLEPVRPTKKAIASATSVTRTTRSQAVAKTTSAQKPATTTKKPSPRKTGRSHFMAPTAASRTRAANVKKGPTQQPAKKKTDDHDHMKDTATAKVSTHRGDVSPPAEPSFAPSNFLFEAPITVSSFVFKPLSPASAAGFLFPQTGANSTTLTTFSDRVDRTSTPKREGQRASSGQTSGKNMSSTACADPSPANTPKDSLPNLQMQNQAAVTSVESPTQIRSDSNNLDSGIEVTGMETVVKHDDGKLTVPFADSATSGEEGDVFLKDDDQIGTMRNISTSTQNKRRSLRQRKEQEVETASSGDNQSGKETEPMIPRSASRGRRKSKRISTLETTQEEPETNVLEEKSPLKQRCRSAVSVSKPHDVSEVPMEPVVEEDTSQPTKPEQEAIEVMTPGRASRRSVVHQSDPVGENESEPMEVGSDVNEKIQNLSKVAKKNGRKSRRSQLPSSDVVGEPQPMETENSEIAQEAEVESAKNKRRSRRSVAKQTAEKEDATATTSKEELITSTKKVTLADVIQTEELLPKVATPEVKKRTLYSAQDDLFLTPGPPPSSLKRSTAKRRCTAAMIALSNATSPEEAIKIISTSPMVEMSRRTPKSKVSPDLRLNTTASLFDDDDLGVEPVQLLSAFGASAAGVDDGTRPADSATPAELQEATESDGNNPTLGEQRDMTPFRERLAIEVKKLTDLADHWAVVKGSTHSLTDEVAGQIDTTVCQAQLLMGRKGKFHQFAGLVDKCEAGDPGTTCQDLQGFQDMIFIQAEDIYGKFSQLERLQQNNWQPEVNEEAASSKPVKKILKKAPAKKKPAVKSKFAAFKAQMLQQQQKVPETDKQGEEGEKVFDAGFFRVSSPVRPPQYHCEAGTPKKPRTSGQSPELKTSTSTLTSSTEKSSNVNNATASATETTTSADKENVAHTLLRRSVGATVRKSYVPVVPSPLVQDGVLKPRSPSPAKSTPKVKDQMAEEVGGAEHLVETPKRSRRSTPGRRSTRSRKSVCFSEQAETVTVVTEAQPEEVDFSAYFQPSTSQSSSPLQDVLENSPFSCEEILRNSQSNTPACVSLSSASQSQKTGVQPKSALKTLPTKERRRSRRSVNFALSPLKPSVSSGVSLPSTPYNRNSLVAGKRVSRSSLASPSGIGQSAIDELQELSNTPQMRRSARPSLLYTPPLLEKDKPRTPARDVPVAKLISFTP